MGLDVKLDAGTATQSVEISATAQLVQTENARVSSTASGYLVGSLPVLVNELVAKPRF